MLRIAAAEEAATTLFDRVSFINFNYDRCVEHFLSNAVQAFFSLPENQLPPMVKGLRVIHPYGAIGSEVQFGSTSADYMAQAEGIKTYTEQVGGTEVVQQVKAEVEWAECIVFLGFAYHSQNLSMLMSPQSMKHKFIYGTAYGMSDSDVDVVTQQILACFNPPMDEWSRSRMFKLENKLKSADLFDYYARSLSGGD